MVVDPRAVGGHGIYRAAAAAELIRVIARSFEDQAGTAVPVDRTCGDSVTSTEAQNGARAVASAKEE
jgi:hypothetical protein